MRVLHVAHAVEGWEAGGVGRYVRELVVAQRALGVDASAVCAEELGRKQRGFRGSWDQPGRATALAERVRAGAGDGPGDGGVVVHIQHFSGLGFGAIDAAKGAGARVVVTSHDHWIGCARGQRVTSHGARCDGPEVAKCARCLRPDGLPGPLGRGRVRARAEAVSSLVPDLWLTVAPHLAPYADLVDLPVLSPPQTSTAARSSGPVRFLYVGSLIPPKGPDVAVDAFSRLPTGAGTLDLVGPAVPYDGSHRYVDHLRGRHVPGATLHAAQDSAPFYDQSDVLLFPSRWDEGCPLVLREAASRGLTILASDVPGARHALAGYPTTWLPVAADGSGLSAWTAALSACVRGVPRHPPARFPTLTEHAADLIRRYEGLF